MRTLICLGSAILIGLGAAAAAPAGDPLVAETGGQALPERLSETGLFLAGTTAVRPEVLAYTPQYPLWSDGASKRRWLSLPTGASIDAARPDAWEFPVGTRLWKEFSHGERVETRLIERLVDGSWRYATYVWNAEQTDALLAPSAGFASLAVQGAPRGRYAIPSRDDCRACHEGSASPVLGLGVLQLSADRDPLAPHAEAVSPQAVDLDELLALGLLINLPPALLERPPRIAASSPTERAALGYLHANCGHCHNDAGPLAILGLSLAQDTGGTSAARTLRSVLDHPSEFRLGGAERRVVAGEPGASVLALRMRSRNPLAQMPPLGTRTADAEGIAIVERWIQQQTLNRGENLP